MTKFFHRGLSCFPEASRLNYNRLSRFGKEWFELCLFHNSPAGFDRFVGPFHSFEREGMTMAQTLTLNTLEADNRSFAGTGGISQGNWHCGFIPGFWIGKPAQFTIPAGLTAALRRFMPWMVCQIT